MGCAGARAGEGHVFIDDELGRLASRAVASVRPNRHDRETIADCWQAAYLAGLQATASAESGGHAAARSILFLKMRDSIYRLLHQPAARALREGDLCLSAN